MKKALKLAALSLALAVVAAGCGGKSADNVTFVLDWTPNTNHTGLYVALDKGYFREAGLDVTIIQPSEGTADQAVASGTAGFGISYQENVTLARVQGMPLVSVAAVIQHNTSGFGSLREKNIMGPRDFEGRTYGGWGGDIEGAMIRYLMEQEGADPTLVNMLTIGDMDFFMASATGKMDFAWMYEGWTLVEARTRNIDMNYFSISEINEVFDYYTPVIITSEQIISQNPELVRRFMGALSRGYVYAIDHPLESARILLKHAPELEEELVMQSQAFLSGKYKDDAPYWGFQKKEVWQRYMEWLYAQDFIPDEIDVEKAFTNDFVKK